MIDSILSSRPEDRRAIFEEAAGITKYKSQKKEALRKLENTEANLIRLADIIREVKRQIGSLQRQAGKARRYQASFEELAALETKFARHQFDTFSATIAALQTEVDGAREKQEQLDSGVTAQEEKVSAARSALAVVETETAAPARGASGHSQCPGKGRAAGRDESRAGRGIHGPARPGPAGNRRHGGESSRRRGTIGSSQCTGR